MLKPKPLPWKTDQFSGFLSAQALDNHYGVNYQGYINKLNKFREDFPELQSLSVQEISANYPMIRPTANQALNHEFFWEILSPDHLNPSPLFYEQITRDFKSFEIFQMKFIEEATNHFGSGWIWLVYDPAGKIFQIISGHDDYSPINDGFAPILTLDVWEHAYYLDYVADKHSYSQNFFRYINWRKVDQLIRSISD